MAVFTVHIRDNAQRLDLVFIKDGFSWMAAIFGFVWALSVGAWGLAVILLGIQGLVGVVLPMLIGDQIVQGVVQIGLAVGIGFVANEGRRVFLQRSGCVEQGVVIGANKADAERRYLEAHPAIATNLLDRP